MKNDMNITSNKNGTGGSARSSDSSSSCTLKERIIKQGVVDQEQLLQLLYKHKPLFYVIYKEQGLDDNHAFEDVFHSFYLSLAGNGPVLFSCFSRVRNWNKLKIYLKKVFMYNVLAYRRSLLHESKSLKRFHEIRPWDYEEDALAKEQRITSFADAFCKTNQCTSLMNRIQLTVFVIQKSQGRIVMQRDFNHSLNPSTWRVQTLRVKQLFFQFLQNPNSKKVLLDPYFHQLKEDIVLRSFDIDNILNNHLDYLLSSWPTTPSTSPAPIAGMNTTPGCTGSFAPTAGMNMTLRHTGSCARAVDLKPTPTN